MRLLLWPEGLLFCTSLALLPAHSYGQWGLCADLTYGKPITVGESSSNDITSAGLHAAVSYQPPGSSLYPSVAFTINELRPDLQNSYYFVSANCTHRNYMLHLNYNLTGGRNYWVAYGGIGVSHIVPDGDLGADTLPGTRLRLVDSGNVHWYPAVDAGLQYLHRLSSKRPLYIGFTGSITYIRMWIDANEYYIQAAHARVKATMQYNVVYPNVMVGLYYFLGRGEDE